MKSHHGTDSMTLVVQDGPLAGQSVPHVHLHLLPRQPGDFPHNDDIYGEVERVDRRRGGDWTVGEMEEEAGVLRELVRNWGK